MDNSVQATGNLEAFKVMQLGYERPRNVMPNISEVLSLGPIEEQKAMYKTSTLSSHPTTTGTSAKHSPLSTSASPIGAENSSYAAVSVGASTIIPETPFPGIPQRTTSRSRPAKQRRHQDLVAFHRNSCQLFSSLDSALAQSRHSSTSSSSSSSESSTLSSSLSLRRPERSTRDSSLNSNFPNLAQDHVTTQSTFISASEARISSKRPILQRMPRTATSTIPNNTPALVSRLQPSPEPTPTPIPAPAHVPSSRPQITTTKSYCSSHPTTPILSTTTTFPPTTNTPLHWTSPATRHHEYMKIDAAHSGIRLFLRTLFPRSICRNIGGGRERFCDGGKDDARSIRRFRVSVDDHEEEEGGMLRCFRSRTQLDIGKDRGPAVVVAEVLDAESFVMPVLDSDSEPARASLKNPLQVRSEPESQSESVNERIDAKPPAPPTMPSTRRTDTASTSSSLASVKFASIRKSHDRSRVQRRKKLRWWSSIGRS